MSAVQRNRPSSVSIRDDKTVEWNDERNVRKPFSSRFANAYLANEHCADMRFYVRIDNVEVPAHSLIVAAASPALHCMCFGTGRETINGGSVITVPDNCSTKVLMIVLRYIYAGGQADGIDESNVGQVLNMADYYDLCELREQCETIIDGVLSVANVCSIFNDIYLLENSAMVDKCMQYMQNNTCEIFANGSAMDMDEDALGKLLHSTNLLSISTEIELVKPMIRWADAQICARSIVPSPMNRRLLLGRRAEMINFGAMTPSEFMRSNHLFGPGFFTHREVSLTNQQIFNLTFGKEMAQQNSKVKVVSSDQAVAPFSSNKRNRGGPTLRNVFFNDFSRFGVATTNTTLTHALQLNVSHMSQPFTLTGFIIHGGRSVTGLINDLTGKLVLVQHKHGAVLLPDGVQPDKNGLISLTFITAESCSYFKLINCINGLNSAVNDDSEEPFEEICFPSARPNFLGNPYTCVTGLRYTVPIIP